jgi:transposase
MDRVIQQRARKDEACQRLTTIPGVGPATATALIAAVGIGSAFRSPSHAGKVSVTLAAEMRRAQLLIVCASSEGRATGRAVDLYLMGRTRRSDFLIRHVK